MFNNLKRVRYGILKGLAETLSLTRIIFRNFSLKNYAKTIIASLKQSKTVNFLFNVS